MTTDSEKKPREFWILPQKGNDCDWTNLYPDESWKSGTKPLIHVREVTPCPNCERLEADKKEYRHEAYVRQKINKQLDDENEKLKSQLAMCKEALEFYASATHMSLKDKDKEQLASGHYLQVGRKARECLAKLEKE